MTPFEDRVLVLTPTGKDARLVCQVLAGAQIQTKECRDMDELCREMDAGVGEIVLTEESLNPRTVSPFLEAMSRQPAWSEIPVLLVGVEGNRILGGDQALARIHSAAKTILLDRPIHVRAFVTLAEEGLRSRRRQYRLQELMANLEESHRQVRRLNENLERRVAARTSELQSMLGELQAFAYTVSHDLRAPLRTMSSISQLVLEDYSGKVLDASAQDYLQRIVDGARRMDALILDLLAYSRLTYAEIKLQRLDLGLLLSDVLRGMKSELDEKRAEVTIPVPLQALMGDPVLLPQALTNLISNAAKFVAPGVTPRIAVTTEPLDGRVRLWVSDNGVGIPREYQDRLFRVFERLHQDYPGTGIGLAIVRKAVERMGGSVGVESEEGRGSRFWIELPKA